MPWSDYTPNVRQFSGLVNAAAQAQFGSAATVQVVSMAARDAGIPLAFADYTSIARLYGTYVRVATARANLTAAVNTFQQTGLDQAVTAQMISQPPWAPPLSDFNLNQAVQVRVQYQYETPAGPDVGYFTTDYAISHLHTVGQLLEDAAAQLEVGAGSPLGPDAEITGNLDVSWTF